VRITILGKSPAWQDAGGACSGYLVEHDGTVLLLDCGNGVFGRLRTHIDYVDVDAVVLSHMHADHCLDVVPYAYALTYAPRQQPVPVGGHPGTKFPARPRLVAPPGGAALLGTLGAMWGPEGLIEGAFDVEEFDPAGQVDIGSLRLTFGAVPHYVPTYAVSLEPVGAAGPRVVYSADCSPNDDVVAFARDAAALLIEATLPRPERTGVRGHLTAAEAGDHGRRAGVRRLILTHYSDELDSAITQRDAEATFGGPVELARADAVFEV
jgi:ribonuclease BN (tRNA processing enzyme)